MTFVHASVGRSQLRVQRKETRERKLLGAIKVRLGVVSYSLYNHTIFLLIARLLLRLESFRWPFTAIRAMAGKLSGLTEPVSSTRRHRRGCKLFLLERHPMYCIDELCLWEGKSEKPRSPRYVSPQNVQCEQGSVEIFKFQLQIVTEIHEPMKS